MEALLRICWCCFVLYLTAIVSIAIPINTVERNRLPASLDDGDTLETTLDEILRKVANMQLKAVYQSDVSLENLDENITDKSESSQTLPKYIVSRVEKIYLFAEATDDILESIKAAENAPREANPKGNAVDSYTADAHTERSTGDNVIQELLTVAKKHTNNPPGWSIRSAKRANDAYDVSRSKLKHIAEKMTSSGKAGETTEEKYNRDKPLSWKQEDHQELLTFLDAFNLYSNKQVEQKKIY